LYYPVFEEARTSGESVIVVPGCDGRPETCKAYDDPDNLEGKFDNYANFGGFIDIPTKAPQFTPLKLDDGSSGKK
jgi:hypothetical protein